MSEESPQSSPPQPTMPEQAQEIIHLENGYYILATSALADDRTRVLKSGETFAVFDRYGDVQPVGLGEQGVFHNGTRYLSRLELRVGGKKPLLLGSEVTRDNALLIVDLANPDVTTRREVSLPRDTLHITRRKFLWEGAAYERLTLQNFGHVAVDIDLSLHYGADFRDIFEVRGMHRSRRGKLLPPYVTNECVTLAYQGRDHVERAAILRATPAPESITAAEMHFDVHLPPGTRQHIELQLTCREGAGEISELDPGAAETSMKADLQHKLAACAITSNSERFNGWHDRSLADLRMMATPLDGGLYPYAGVPWYSTVFGRDGIIAALQMLWAAPELARGVLTTLARLQATEVDAARDAEPGKILHEMRGGEMAALGEVPFGQYYGSIDATPLFVMLAGMYYTRTADLDLVAALWPHIERALTWIDQYGDRDGDGFVEYATEAHDGLVQQGWKDSHDSVFHRDGSDAPAPIALCEVQGYVYAARREAARLARALGRPELAAAQEQRADELHRNFGRAFWSRELGGYALALDGHKRPCLVGASNMGHCLYTGIATVGHAAVCAKTLLASHFFSGWGVRTLAEGEARFNPMSYHNGSVWPHDNSLIAAGLARYGFKRGAARVMEALFEASTVVELHRLPELYCGFTRGDSNALIQYPLACAPQAWASGALFLCLQACLGLEIDATRMRVLFRQPLLPPFLRELHLGDLRVGKASMDLTLRRAREDVSLEITRRKGKVEIVVSR